ncbi:t-SNARE domain-containing protein 1-like [Lissotriton helveticus]
MASSSEKEQPERKRKIKFSTMELQVLVEEVVKEHQKLFGKLSLTVAESAKRKIWLDIQAKVNAVGVTPRDIDDLKKRWYDLRSLTKKQIAEQHKQANKTGGGKNRAPPLTDQEELVGSTIEPESVSGLGDADSSARAATKQGETSRRRTRETEGPAPERDDSQEPGPSAEIDTEDTDLERLG